MNRYRLVEALRRLNALAMESDAPDDVLEAAADTAEQIAETLSAHPSARMETPAGGLAEHSFIHGRANPIAPPACYTIAGNRLDGSVTFRTPHQSRPGFAHGGAVAALFDDMLGALELSGEVRGPTAQLTVRFLRLVPVGRPLDLVATIDKIEGRKILVSGHIISDGQVCAESEALFIAPKPAVV